MTWVTWRQHRQDLYAMVIALAALGVVYLALRGALTGYLDRSGLAACLTHPDEGCGHLIDGLREQYPSLLGVLPFLNLAPVLVGVFVGAPLIAREFEQGTHRLVWTQTVSRRRWLLVKLGALSVLCVLVGLGLGAVDRWFLEPYIAGSVVSPVAENFVGLIGVAPAAYTLFAFSVGAAAGSLVRRTLPSMAVTVIVFVAARLAWEGQRGQVLAPMKTVAAVDAVGVGGPGRHDWVMPISPWVDARGAPVSDALFGPWCDGQSTKGSFEACLAQHGVYSSQSWQPADRFWNFQWLDVAIFGGFALILLGVTVRATLRRAI
jgi:ABC-2 family transporter protein